MYAVSALRKKSSVALKSWNNAHHVQLTGALNSCLYNNKFTVTIALPSVRLRAPAEGKQSASSCVALVVARVDLGPQPELVSRSGAVPGETQNVQPSND